MYVFKSQCEICIRNFDSDFKAKERDKWIASVAPGTTVYSVYDPCWSRDQIIVMNIEMIVSSPQGVIERPLKEPVVPLLIGSITICAANLSPCAVDIDFFL